MRPRRPGDDELNAVARRRLALIGQELDLLGGGDAAPTDDLSSDPPAESAPRVAVAVPAAGRHRADHRAAPPTRAQGWVPDSLRGRVRLAPQHVALLGVVVALALAVTTWWVLSAVGDADETSWAAPAVPATGLVEDRGTPGDPSPSAVQTTDGPEAGEADPDAGTVVVHVAGKVRRPGIVTLPLGSRVADAVEEAGGVRPRVDTSTLNLARVLVDGEQILVGVAPAVPPSGTTDPAGAAGTPGAAGLVNLNTATQAELETLNGVGPVTAQAIVAWREEHGRFTAVEELLEVSGIGEKTLAQLAPHVTL
ncbi:helix-hairpin-helix domain-containing protein [Nocardioides massiliensis]|uniref:Competence protein ComEA n=1 Tax=Nocardioides massiliensis TaxID=1325935 RepID=A0ABT9NPP1_9ACTN|nr:helix-hairpin-helix domain-containing protein [Nocardioides massiliensis]MDP9822401.1 competence protein ComEA [Nocardioides massiliensis]